MVIVCFRSKVVNLQPGTTELVKDSAMPEISEKSLTVENVGATVFFQVLRKTNNLEF